MKCDRCGDNFEKLYPLDAPISAASQVCNGCLKDTDEVVDV